MLHRFSEDVWPKVSIKWIQTVIFLYHRMLSEHATIGFKLNCKCWIHTEAFIMQIYYYLIMISEPARQSFLIPDLHYRSLPNGLNCRRELFEHGLC